MNQSQAGSAEQVVTEGLGFRPMKPQRLRTAGAMERFGWQKKCCLSMMENSLVKPLVTIEIS